jgi:hypothetical protein
VLVGIGLESGTELCNILCQSRDDGGGDSSKDIVGKAQQVSHQTGDWSSKDCRASSGEKNSRRFHCEEEKNAGRLKVCDEGDEV